jgi:hypothetical protein
LSASSHEPAAEAASALGKAAVLALLAGGLVLTTLLAAFVVLYANVPAGYNAPYGLSLDSPLLFRQLWPYPTFELEPRRFGMFAALLVLGLWAT